MLLPPHTAKTSVHKSYIFNLSQTPRPGNLSKRPVRPLDFDLVDWIPRHAGGVPGELFAAASVGNILRHDLTSFVDAVGHELTSPPIRDTALRHSSYRLFSVLTHVGISGTVEAEIRHICDLFGEGWTPHTALASLRVLERAGIARRGGSFRITLPLLANYLVSQLLQGRQLEMLALFGRLDNPGGIRFIKQLSEVRNEEVERFWDAVFASDGLLKDFRAALSHLYLLTISHCRLADRVLRCLNLDYRTVAGKRGWPLKVINVVTWCGRSNSSSFVSAQVEGR